MHLIPISYPKSIIIKDNVQSKLTKDNLYSENWEIINTPKGRDILVLVKQGLLFLIEPSDGINVTEIQNFEQQIGLFTKQPLGQLQTYYNSLTLVIEHRCNFKCSYCFAIEHGVCFSGSVKSMPFNDIRTSIDWFFQQLPSGKKGSITLFGGEPLIHKEIIRVINYIKNRKCKDKIKCEIIIFTNGSLITPELVDEIKYDYDIKIMLSIDGPPSINDSSRMLLNGKESSSLVLMGISLLKDLELERIIARITLNDVPVKIVERVQYLNSIGLNNVAIDVAYSGCDSINKYIEMFKSLTEELNDLAEYYKKCILTSKKININIFSEPVAKILSSKVNLKENCQCPAGKTIVAVDSDLTVYPCHRYVGLERYAIGKLQSMSNNCDTVTTIEKYCANCWCQRLCGNLCPSIMDEIRYDAQVIEAYCTYQKKRIEYAIDLIVDIYGHHLPHEKLWQNIRII